MTSKSVIHVVDDDAAIRRGLARLLEGAGHATLTYSTAGALLDAVPGLAAGLVLLDVQLPGIGGLELLTRLMESGVVLPVIMMTGHGDIPTAVRAMKAGAADFIEKPIDERHLLTSIDAALGENKPVQRDSDIADAAHRLAALSPRERQVLDAITFGRSTKVIAHDLGISVRTVEVHRARMLVRLGVRTVAQAVRIAVMVSFAISEF
jgi:two-component system response regulator FixJ